MSERDSIRDKGEPLWTDQRKAIDQGGSLYVNIPEKFVSKIQSIEEGDEIDVEIYPTCAVISPRSE